MRLMANGYELVDLTPVNACQRPDFDKLHSLAMQHPGDFVNGRAGGDDVVDNGDVAIFAARLVIKSQAHVFDPLVSAQAGLQGSGADTCQRTVIQWDIEIG